MNPSQPLEIHGHRGSRGTHPENTFAAFEEAWRVGADWFEIDVRPTADGEIVVFHDPCVDATNAKRLDGSPVEGSTPVVALTRDQLAAFDVGFARTARFPRQKAVWGSTIPTLVDVCRWLGRHARIGLNVELKPDGIATDDATAERYCRRVADALAAAPSLSRVMVQSFDPRLVTRLKAWYPKLRSAVLYEGPDDYFGIAEAAGADGIGPQEKLVDRAMVDGCRRRSLKLVPWTANDPARWRALVHLGVDGIITDYPEELRRLVPSGRPL